MLDYGFSQMCLLVTAEFRRSQNKEDTDFKFLSLHGSTTPTDNTIIGSCLSSSVRNNAIHSEVLSASSSFLQSHQAKLSRRWTSMKENSVITVREAFLQAKTGDRGRLITRYSMSTCCVKGAKAGTKDLNVKTCTKVG